MLQQQPSLARGGTVRGGAPHHNILPYRQPCSPIKGTPTRGSGSVGPANNSLCLRSPKSKPPATLFSRESTTTGSAASSISRALTGSTDSMGTVAVTMQQNGVALSSGSLIINPRTHQFNGSIQSKEGNGTRLMVNGTLSHIKSESLADKISSGAYFSLGNQRPTITNHHSSQNIIVVHEMPVGECGQYARHIYDYSLAPSQQQKNTPNAGLSTLRKVTPIGANKISHSDVQETYNNKSSSRPSFFAAPYLGNKPPPPEHYSTISTGMGMLLFNQGKNTKSSKSPSLTLSIQQQQQQQQFRSIIHSPTKLTDELAVDFHHAKDNLPSDQLIRAQRSYRRQLLNENNTVVNTPKNHHRKLSPRQSDLTTQSTKSSLAASSNPSPDVALASMDGQLKDLIATLPDLFVIEPAKSVFSGWQVVSLLGSGTFASVYKVKHFRTGERAAAKLLAPHKFRSSTRKRVIEMFANEIRYSVVCQCPGVVGIKQIIRGAEGWLIVQDLIDGGTLWEDFKCSSKIEQFSLFVQLLQTVFFMQEKSVVHRDLKPTNILRSADGSRVWVTDFGWSEQYSRMNEHVHELPGTIEINPPEVLNHHATQSEKIDNYALGMNLMLLTTHQFVCRDKELSTNDAANKVLESVSVIRKGRPLSEFSSQGWDTFLGLSEFDPSKRWTLYQVIESYWFVSSMVQLLSMTSPSLGSQHLIHDRSESSSCSSSLSGILWHRSVCDLATRLQKCFCPLHLELPPSCGTVSNYSERWKKLMMEEDDNPLSDESSTTRSSSKTKTELNAGNDDDSDCIQPTNNVLQEDLVQIDVEKEFADLFLTKSISSQIDTIDLRTYNGSHPPHRPYTDYNTTNVPLHHPGQLCCDHASNESSDRLDSTSYAIFDNPPSNDICSSGIQEASKKESCENEDKAKKKLIGDYTDQTPVKNNIFSLSLGEDFGSSVCSQSDTILKKSDYRRSSDHKGLEFIGTADLTSHSLLTAEGEANTTALFPHDPPCSEQVVAGLLYDPLLEHPLNKDIQVRENETHPKPSSIFDAVQHSVQTLLTYQNSDSSHSPEEEEEEKKEEEEEEEEEEEKLVTPNVTTEKENASRTAISLLKENRDIEAEEIGVQISKSLNETEKADNPKGRDLTGSNKKEIVGNSHSGDSLFHQCHTNKIHEKVKIVALVRSREDYDGYGEEMLNGLPSSNLLEMKNSYTKTKENNIQELDFKKKKLQPLEDHELERGRVSNDVEHNEQHQSKIVPLPVPQRHHIEIPSKSLSEPYEKLETSDTSSRCSSVSRAFYQSIGPLHLMKGARSPEKINRSDVSMHPTQMYQSCQHVTLHRDKTPFSSLDSQKRYPSQKTHIAHHECCPAASLSQFPLRVEILSTSSRDISRYDNEKYDEETPRNSKCNEQQFYGQTLKEFTQCSQDFYDRPCNGLDRCSGSHRRYHSGVASNKKIVPMKCTNIGTRIPRALSPRVPHDHFHKLNPPFRSYNNCSYNQVIAPVGSYPLHYHSPRELQQPSLVFRDMDQQAVCSATFSGTRRYAQ